MEGKGLWQAALGELEVTISRANFATWFRHTSIVANNDGLIVIAVPNIFTKEWLEKKYDNDIKSALTRVCRGFKGVEYKVKSTSPEKLDPVLAETLATIPKAVSGPQSPTLSDTHSNINSKYTFETFVVGSSNELAYAACQAVAKHPGTKYNPLFLYGGVGLGKTHLMQAVGNEILRTNPNKRVAYLTSEGFTNEFLSSLSRKKSETFVEKYRRVDVLIVDDMQFLAGKEKTQEEFFHTFNALHQSNKQIIISSDKPPKAIAGLEERLRSRFEWGMTADIQAPDLETRSAILMNKANSQGITLPLEVVDYLARTFTGNIRELEGALTKLLAHCELYGSEPTLMAAQALLGSMGLKPRQRALTAKVVLEKIAAYFDLQVSDLVGIKRDKEIVVPRQMAMYLMRHELGMSFPKIALSVGGRDHTTAMHSVSKIERSVEGDEILRQELVGIKEQLYV
ncbi:MAG TPA: chromosomal replication initiator protein DnaA [Candidatus Saccharimonadales bacterium]|nr:chromosomal replication initiator protein DnaA [Candidatus Saccharimonadales bacterium]